MVEQENLFDKEKLKNKRFLKDTPLYAYATRYAKKFALGLGCAHVTFIVLGYYSNVSKEFLSAGPRQRDEAAGRCGLYEMREDEPSIKWEEAKDIVKHSPGYTFIVHYYELLKNSFSRSIEESETSKAPALTKEEPSALKDLK